LFSATYNEEVKALIGELIKEAQQISLKNEQLNLAHVKQYEYKCPSKGKIDFVVKLFAQAIITQTIIFVNTK
jgi:superfamily II DNA/RNA helicase